jgi:hypothetical protein
VPRTFLEWWLDEVRDYRGLFPTPQCGRVTTMKKLSDADLDELRWMRAGEPHLYQLVSGSETVATLHWDRPAETHASAEAEGTHWTIRRSGFLTPMVAVQEAPDGKQLALLHVHLNSGLLQVSGGSTYRWSRTGFWIPAWEFQDPTGRELVDFEPVREGTRLDGGLLEVTATGKADPNLLLLLVLGWYFIVQAWIEDDAIAASRAILDASPV